MTVIRVLVCLDFLMVTPLWSQSGRTQERDVGPLFIGEPHQSPVNAECTPKLFEVVFVPVNEYIPDRDWIVVAEELVYTAL